MRFIDPFNTEYCTLELSINEVKKLNRPDENIPTVAKLANMLCKFEEWTDDVKRIRTRELLKR